MHHRQPSHGGTRGIDHLQADQVGEIELVVLGRWPAIALALLCLAAAAGCRSTYYAAYEKFGVHKRDLLKKRVTAARDGQQAAQEQFRDALTRLKEITAFSGGELERAHQALKTCLLYTSPSPRDS